MEAWVSRLRPRSPCGLDPGRARDADADRLVGDPVVRHDDRARAKPADVRGPSSRNGMIASSTVTEAIVIASRCGFVTRMRISPGWNSTRRMSNSSAGGGFWPIRSKSESPHETNGADDDARRSTGTSAQSRQRDAPPACGRPRLHQSSTSKKPIQPSSANSDWCAWNMNVPVCAKSISRTPR